MPQLGDPIVPILGARPLRPGDLEGLWPQEKHDEIVKRTKYLVNDDLEEPPHIRRAREILKERGGDWRTASEKELLKIIHHLPRQLFHPTHWKRRPYPPPESEYHDLMTRIHRSELEFYGFDSTSLGGQFLHMLRDARQDPDPASFYQRLRQAGLAIDRVVHFTRATVLGGDSHLLSLPLRLEVRRDLFVGDLARFLGQMQGSRGEIPHRTWELPGSDGKEDEYIEEGILKIDGRSFVYDTTLNNSVLQAIQEADLRPAVIMKELTFWRDGADQDAEALGKAAWLDYGTTHWLSQYYDVFSRHPGSGFVTCNPTIYIRKGKSLVHALKRSASNLVKVSRSDSRLT